MATTFKPCTGTLSVNLDIDCNHPRVKGYEQIGVIINRADIVWPTTTADAADPHILTEITLKEGKTGYVIYNNRNNPLPFDGTQTSYNSDSDAYDKTVQFYSDKIGGDVSENAIEPLKGGDYVVILNRKDHRGDGSFQVFGWQSGMKATAEVQDESTGYWLITMTGQEPYAEISFFKTNYSTTETAFRALYGDTTV